MTPRAAGAPGGIAVRRTTVRRTTRTTAPSLRVERALQRDGYRVLAGMDEVGRGALAGPVTVGVVCIDESARTAPSGVRDSKLLTPARREALVAPVRRWALAWGVGHASAAEIDAVGIIAALRLAGRRALAACGVTPDLVILDGKHDWLSNPAEEGLLGLLDEADPAPPVHTRIKADLSCSSVAAASVLAKVERDGLMVGHAAAYPDYEWDVNKGYAAPGHLAALGRLGPCELHRRSWNLARHVAAGGEDDETLATADGATLAEVFVDAGRGVPADVAGGRRTHVPGPSGPVVGEASAMGHDGRLEVRVDGR